MTVNCIAVGHPSTLLKRIFVLPTIRDVAKRANVSVSTASRVLSKSSKEKFTDKTRARVLKASVELGYRPNFAARALVSGETHIVAAIFPRIYDTPFTALASLQIMSGIESYCSDNGYHMLISSPKITEDVLDPHFISLLSGGYLDGAIIDGHFNITPIMDFIAHLNLHTVVIGHHPHTHYLRSDNLEGGKLMMCHLLAQGHRKIGVISVPDIVERMRGVQLAAEEYNVEFDSLPVVVGNFSQESGEIATKKLIDMCPDLTAIVAFNDRMAMGAINQLKKMGYKVPEQVSVVGYDDLPRSSDFSPSLTTVNHRLDEWGALAMTMLHTLMQGENPGSQTLKPELIIRESTAPLSV